MNAAETLPALNHLDLPDQRIAYRDRPGTDPDALPLLLLHGGAVDSRMWGPQLGAFPERRMLAPEARGHGGSSDADAPYRLVDDVVALLDALEIAQVVAVGISMGEAPPVTSPSSIRSASPGSWWAVPGPARSSSPTPGR